MKKDRVFFQTGLFEKPFLNSRITTASMTMKEKILGYLVGPVGILALVAIVNQLLELYYTEVFYIDEIFGAGNYLLMSWVTKAVGIVAGLLIAYVVEHNVSSQGRMCSSAACSALFPHSFCSIFRIWRTGQSLHGCMCSTFCSMASAALCLPCVSICSPCVPETRMTGTL